jgi:hypothetical protein
MNENFDTVSVLRWLVSVAVGAGLGLLAGFMFTWSVSDTIERAAGEIAVALVSGSFFGAVVSLGANVGPALLLARKGIPASRWLAYSALLTALSMALALMLARSSFEQAADLPGVMLLGVVLGLPQGIGQALLLRGLGNRASVWAGVSTVAYVLAVVALMFLGGEGREWIALGASGLLLGGITALGIVWLQRAKSLAVAA